MYSINSLKILTPLMKIWCGFDCSSIRVQRRNLLKSRKSQHNLRCKQWIRFSRFLTVLKACHLIFIGVESFLQVSNGFLWHNWISCAFNALAVAVKMLPLGLTIYCLIHTLSVSHTVRSNDYINSILLIHSI